MTQWEKMMVFYGSHHRSRANIVAHILCSHHPDRRDGAAGAGRGGSAGAANHARVGRGDRARGDVLPVRPYLRDRLAGDVRGGAARLSCDRRLALDGGRARLGLGLFLGGYTAQFVAHGVEGKEAGPSSRTFSSPRSPRRSSWSPRSTSSGFRRELFARVEAEIERLEGGAAWPPADGARARPRPLPGGRPQRRGGAPGPPLGSGGHQVTPGMPVGGPRTLRSCTIRENHA